MHIAKIIKNSYTTYTFSISYKTTTTSSHYFFETSVKKTIFAKKLDERNRN